MKIDLYLEFLNDVAKLGNVQEAARGWEIKQGETIGWVGFGGTNTDFPKFLDGFEYRRKPKSHKHAELILQYAHDAAECEKPWDRWEYKELTESCWYKCLSSPLWALYVDYRRIEK